MADNEILIEIKAKTDQVEKSVAGIKKEVSSIGQSLSGDPFKGATESIGNFAKDIAKAGIAIFVLKKSIELVGEALDIALEGEKIKAINKEFEFLAKNAGLAASALKEGLAGAAGGLIEDTVLLEAANKAIVQLGTSATRLPETLELARKAGVAFGVDTVQAFELLNQSIASQNTRSLRQLGIIVDSVEAQKEYAKKIGVTVSSLTEAGREQAILNAVLQKGKTALAGIDPATRSLANAFTAFKVASKDALDSFKVAFEEAFGPTIRAAFQQLTIGQQQFGLNLKSLTKEGLSSADNISKLTIELGHLEIQLAGVNQQIENQKKTGTFDPVAKLNADKLTADIDKIQSELERLNLIQQKADARKFVAEKTDASTKPPAILFNQEQLTSEEEKLRSAITQANAAVLQIKQQGQSDITTDLLNKEAQRLLIEQQFADQRAAINLQRKTQEGTNEQLFADQLVAIENLKNAKLKALQETANANLLKVKAAVQSNVVNGITSAFAGLGAALAKGENGFAAFGKAVIGALGAMAIQIGTMLVGIGLGFQALGPVIPIFGLSGTAAVIAGIALIGLGGVLSALGGGEAGSPAGSGGGAGFSGAGGFTDINAQPDIVDENATRAKGTVVNVNVAGNVFDRRESGLEIAKIIQEQFDLNGSIIAQGATV